jgi:hypothetical protein
VARQHDPRAVPLFDAIAGLDTPDAAGIDETAPISMRETAAADPSPPDPLLPHDLGGSGRQRHATRTPLSVAAAAGLLVAAIAAGILARPNHSQPVPSASPIRAVAAAPPAAETVAVPPRPPSVLGDARTRRAPRDEQSVSRVPRTPRRSTAPTPRAHTAVGNPADEFAP